ncbi:hypothetical protein [Hymenobacter lucidus]|uniref:DUF2846 domain-containing protein n=1 Tax=Hymenobacter lucidus TaxID=2880930 RepID=A0ABS8AUU1_9BACT|nr:hypothetical protein [Hymenobacter lucidus]MCB2409988.1 hypothetical protein [Hymenobacter lucidus]
MTNRNQLFVGLLLAGLMQGSAMAQSVEQSKAEAGTATVHFYQGKAYGLFYIKYRVYANGQLVCKLGRNSHCQVELPAGATTFTANTALTKPAMFTFGSKPALPLTLEAGKSYYLQGDLAAAGARTAGVSYGFSEVVPNASKLAQISQSKPVQPLALTSR